MTSFNPKRSKKFMECGHVPSSGMHRCGAALVGSWTSGSFRLTAAYGFGTLADRVPFGLLTSHRIKGSSRPWLF